MRTETRPARTSFIEEHRRAQVVAAAIQTVVEQGYRHASLARIAGTAGISKSVISYHFSGKDELLETVVEQVTANIDGYLRPRIDAQPTAAGKLRTAITAQLEYLAEHRAEFVALDEIVANHRWADRKPVFAGDAVIGELTAILRAGQESGEFRDFDTRVLAVTVARAVDGAMSQWAGGAVTDLAAFARELVTVFELATRKERR